MEFKKSRGLAKAVIIPSLDHGEKSIFEGLIEQPADPNDIFSWREHPAELNRIIDWWFVAGCGRVVIPEVIPTSPAPNWSRDRLVAVMFSDHPP